MPDYFRFLQCVQTFIVSLIFQGFTLTSQLNKTCNFPVICFESEKLQLEKKLRKKFRQHYVQFMYLIPGRIHCRNAWFFYYFLVSRSRKKLIRISKPTLIHFLSTSSEDFSSNISVSLSSPCLFDLLLLAEEKNLDLEILQGFISVLKFENWKITSGKLLELLFHNPIGVCKIKILKSNTDLWKSTYTQSFLSFSIYVKAQSTILVWLLDSLSTDKTFLLNVTETLQKNYLSRNKTQTFGANLPGLQ